MVPYPNNPIFICVLKPDGQGQSIIDFSVDGNGFHIRLHLQGEVFVYIVLLQVGIHVGIDDIQGVKPNGNKQCEVPVALNAFLARVENIQLAEGKNDLTHWPNMVLRGLKALHISFDKSA